MNVPVDEMGAVAASVPIHHGIVANGKVGSFTIAFNHKTDFFEPVGEVDGAHPGAVVIADDEVFFAIEARRCSRLQKRIRR